MRKNEKSEHFYINRHAPLVSIITPNFNSSKFIESTICSIINQSYSNIEYIVIDGGSTDGSLDIIHKHKSSIDYWCSENDEGMYHAINKGLNHATGEIVAYLNSDDLYYPDTISKVVSIFNRNPDIDFIYGDLDYIGVDNEVLFTQRFPDFNWKRFANSRFSMIGQPAAFWRRSLHAKYGFFDLTFQMAGDFEFFLRVSRNGQTMHIDDVLAAFRVHSGSLTSKQLALGLDEVKRVHSIHLTHKNTVMSKFEVAFSEIMYKALNWRALLSRSSRHLSKRF